MDNKTVEHSAEIKNFTFLQVRLRQAPYLCKIALPQQPLHVTYYDLAFRLHRFGRLYGFSLAPTLGPPNPDQQRLAISD